MKNLEKYKPRNVAGKQAKYAQLQSNKTGQYINQQQHSASDRPEPPCVVIKHINGKSHKIHAQTNNQNKKNPKQLSKDDKSYAKALFSDKLISSIEFQHCNNKLISLLGKNFKSIKILNQLLLSKPIKFEDCDTQFISHTLKYIADNSSNQVKKLINNFQLKRARDTQSISTTYILSLKGDHNQKRIVTTKVELCPTISALKCYDQSNQDMDFKSPNNLTDLVLDCKHVNDESITNILEFIAKFQHLKTLILYNLVDASCWSSKTLNHIFDSISKLKELQGFAILHLNIADNVSTIFNTINPNKKFLQAIYLDIQNDNETDNSSLLDFITRQQAVAALSMNFNIPNSITTYLSNTLTKLFLSNIKIIKPLELLNLDELKLFNVDINCDLDLCAQLPNLEKITLNAISTSRTTHKEFFKSLMEQFVQHAKIADIIIKFYQKCDLSDVQDIIDRKKPIKSFKIYSYHITKDFQQNCYELTEFIAKKIAKQASLPKLAIINCVFNASNNSSNSKCQEMLETILKAKNYHIALSNILVDKNIAQYIKEQYQQIVEVSDVYLSDQKQLISFAVEPMTTSGNDLSINISF